MSTDAFTDFLFGACLIDWAELAERLQRRSDQTKRKKCGSSARAPTSGSRWPAARCASRRREQPPRRRVLRLPGRGLGRKRDRLHRVSGRARRSRAERDPAALRGRQGRRRERRHERGLSCSRHWTRTKARGGRRARDRQQPWRHALHEEHPLRREDRQHRAPRTATPTTTSAARTSRASLRHRSATSGTAAGSSSTATWCRRTGHWVKNKVSKF